MPKKKTTKIVKTEKKSPKEIIYEAICPTCNKGVEGHKCRFCGATKTINQVSGNLIWMRNGRVISAFKDEKIAWVQMANANGIPKDKWPERFRD
jgi:hypothetical protein